ncbi:MAG: hypothetical protein WCA39_01595 [Nitrososphaeraceae archaeon]
MIKKLVEVVIKVDQKTSRILQLLAKRNRPLSSREMEKMIVGDRKKRDRQVYRIIDNELCIKKFEHKFFLFIWKDLLESIDSKVKVRKEINLNQVINNINAIDWPFDWSTAEFEKDDDGNTITITKGLTDPRIMRIERNPKSMDRAILTIFKDKQRERESQQNRGANKIQESRSI